MDNSLKNNANKFVIFTVFIIFFEIGIPNSIIGAAWPVMRAEMGLPLEHIGFINIAFLISSMFACIFSGNVFTHFDFKRIFPIAIIVFVLMIFVVTQQNSFTGLLIVLIPVGYSMGTLDSGTNLYASINFESRYISLLHCCWGIGAMAGPLIMVAVISGGMGWRWCFGIIALIGLVPLISIFRCTIKNLWKSVAEKQAGNPSEIPENEVVFTESQQGGSDIRSGKSESDEGKLSGILYQFYSVTLYFMLAGSNATMSALISSYMDEMWSTRIEIGGITVTFFLASLTLGRIITGVVVKKTGNLIMLRIGLIVALIGCVAGIFADSPTSYQICVILYGLGTSPVFPLLIHETPIRFTEKVSRKLVGFQVAGAQLGGSVLTMVVAAILAYTDIKWLMPIEVILYSIVLILNELIVRKKRIINKS